MRFLFVSCCGSSTQRAPERAVPPEEEERSLVPSPAPASSSARAVQRVKRGRMSGSDWRPSLRSISEDTAVPPKKRGSPQNDAVDTARRNVKGGSRGSASAAKVRHRHHTDGYHGSAAMPTIVPTFYPTPFMF